MTDTPAAPPRNRNRGCLWTFLLLFGFPMVMFGGLVTCGLVLMPSEQKIEKDSYLRLSFEGGLTEAPADPIDRLFNGHGAPSTWDMRQAIRAAASDEDIKGILLSVRTSPLGISQIEEVHAAISAFKAAGKPVIADLGGDIIEENQLLLASIADTIYATPETMFLVNGLVAQVSFLRGTLDKLHIKPEVLMFEEYKSAGEMLKNYEMSPANREAVTAIVDDAEARMAELFAGNRGVSEDVLAALYASGMQSAPELKAAKLIDEIGYADEAKNALDDAVGTELEKVTLRRYLKSVPDASMLESNKVALIVGEGQIVAGESKGLFPSSGMFEGPKVARYIREAVDDGVKAILFRVNSPGGSAAGSDLVWREIERAKEKGIPVVVSMGSVAGSGGYWVSMGADAIVANRTTITGSIGVVFTRFDLTEFLDWTGTNIEGIKKHDNADILSPMGPLEPAQRERIRVVVGNMYQNFITKVADGRGLDKEATRGLAKGRIWSGKRALGHKLVDALGGYDTALGLIEEKAGLSEGTYGVKVYPGVQDAWEQLLEERFGATTKVFARLDVGKRIEALNDLLDDMSRARAEVRMPSIELR